LVLTKLEVPDLVPTSLDLGILLCYIKKKKLGNQPTRVNKPNKVTHIVTHEGAI
jgi:hypothetical protein